MQFKCIIEEYDIVFMGLGPKAATSIIHQRVYENDYR